MESNKGYVASQITHDDAIRSQLAEREAVSSEIKKLYEDCVSRNNKTEAKEQFIEET